MASSNLCSVSECGKPAYCKGLCRGHYMRLWRYGSAHGGSTSIGEPERWIVEHAKWKDTIDCLIWPFVRRVDGYGELWINGKRQRAHRVMCEAAHGVAPSPNLDAAHSCGKGGDGCCNPHHLRWASRVENMADCIEHETRPWGEKHGHAKLTSAQVDEIRSLKGKKTQQLLAEEFGVCQMTISNIHNAVTWRDPSNPGRQRF